MAAAIIGVKKAWCCFDAAVYRHAGAGSVEWHQDFATSTMGTPKRSVHFWIPLNDHFADAGSLVFVPGSHRNGLAKHRLGTRLSRLAPHTTEIPDGAPTVSMPLSVGSFSIHTAWTTHGSSPNRTDQTRKSLVLEFSPGPWSAAREIGPALVNSLLARSRAG